jgi:hypothetical protein
MSEGASAIRRCLPPLLLGLVALTITAAHAQTPLRVRGTITSVDGNVLSVKNRDGRDLKVELADTTAVAAVQAVKLSDIKPGDGVGATTRPGPGDTLTALEVHVFPASMPVPNEGHRPWDLEPGSMMTNARVTAVLQSTSGRELTLTYKDGTQKILVPEGTPVVTAVAADRSALKPGEYVFFSAVAGADGKLTPAGRIQVSRDGVKPPM